MTGRPGWNVLFSSKRKLPSRDFQNKKSLFFFSFLFFCDWIVSRLKEVRRLSGIGSGKATSAPKRACFASCAEAFSLNPGRHCTAVWSGCWTVMKRSRHMTCNRVSYFIMVASVEMISHWHRTAKRSANGVSMPTNRTALEKWKGRNNMVYTDQDSVCFFFFSFFTNEVIRCPTITQPVSYITFFGHFKGTCLLTGLRTVLSYAPLENECRFNFPQSSFHFQPPSLRDHVKVFDSKRTFFFSPFILLFW